MPLLFPHHHPPVTDKVSQPGWAERSGNWCGKSARFHPETHGGSASGWAWKGGDKEEWATTIARSWAQNAWPDPVPILNVRTPEAAAFSITPQCIKRPTNPGWLHSPTQMGACLDYVPWHNHRETQGHWKLHLGGNFEATIVYSSRQQPLAPSCKSNCGDQRGLRETVWVSKQGRLFCGSGEYLSLFDRHPYFADILKDSIKYEHEESCHKQHIYLSIIQSACFHLHYCIAQHTKGKQTSPPYTETGETRDPRINRWKLRQWHFTGVYYSTALFSPSLSIHMDDPTRLLFRFLLLINRHSLSMVCLFYYLFLLLHFWYLSTLLEEKTRSFIYTQK